MKEPRIITRAERLARKQAAKTPKITGAGDAFALIAQPAAKLIDSVAGTNLANCLPCKKRRAAWNKAIPFTKPTQV